METKNKLGEMLKYFGLLHAIIVIYKFHRIVGNGCHPQTLVSLGTPPRIWQPCLLGSSHPYSWVYRSPIQEVINTPQFQLRKVRKQLAEERDMRDEVERELADTSQLVSEKGTALDVMKGR